MDEKHHKNTPKINSFGPKTGISSTVNGYFNTQMINIRKLNRSIIQKIEPKLIKQTRNATPAIPYLM